VGRFRAKLADEGHDEATIARITTPIGLPELTGKEPATIAVSVAAALLHGFERERPAVAELPRVTLFPGTFLDTPTTRSRRRLRAESTGAAGARRRDRRAGGVRGPARPHGDEVGRPAAAWCCPGSSTPTCTSPRCG
jgi:hypothetical protein